MEKTKESRLCLGYLESTVVYLRAWEGQLRAAVPAMALAQCLCRIVRDLNFGGSKSKGQGEIYGCDLLCHDSRSRQ